MRKYTFVILSSLFLSLQLQGNNLMKDKFEIASFGGMLLVCGGNF